MAHDHDHSNSHDQKAHGHKPHGHKHHGHKFHTAHLDRLRDPERLKYLNPEVIWSVIGTRPISTVVDLGAGLGFFSIPFAKKLPGGRVYACDANAEMMEHLKAALADARQSNIVPVQTEEVRIPLDDACADLVFMANVHHELDDPVGTLKECRRLLRPGGALAIIDWKPEETPMGPPPEVRVSADTMRAQLKEAGLGAIHAHSVLPYHTFLVADA